MKTSSKVLIVSLVLVLVIAILLGAMLYKNKLLERYETQEDEPDMQAEEEIVQPSPEIEEPDPENTGDDITADDEPSADISEPYKCPSELKDAIGDNPDIYAWLTITDAEISYPVCNRPGENGYYLNHSSSGRWDPMGAIFTEDYNKRDFSDSAVVVYGHSMTGKKYFGTLQKNYSSKDFFEAHREIKIYLEDKELTYRIFAAIPFTDEHILYYYDFSQKIFFDAFMKSVRSVRTLDSIIDSESIPEYGTQLLILSTCLKSYNNKRFLVLASLCD